MIVKYFKRVGLSYVESIAEIAEQNETIKSFLGITLAIIGLTILIFNRYCSKILIYNHMSLIISALGWYFLTTTLNGNAAICFFVGSLCANITFIIRNRKSTDKNIYILIILWMIYFPFLDLAFDLHSVLFWSFAIVSLFMLLFISSYKFYLISNAFIGSVIFSVSVFFLFDYEKYHGLEFVRLETIYCIMLTMTITIFLHMNFSKPILNRVGESCDEIIESRVKHDEIKK
ncbi:hypothetical protein CWI37_0789p0020 [Hamiltosporidium tvaerminnensis]|uniref:Uncharacterized protein n=1 Tax=Hamiltosporidium tvaerminnensis TaxID=1176355 RepID=A0A4Q9L1A8_9MICR|nr:hypothetical protein CWI37_0789p0020 [Hamiltosporidium tvaerminnensis]